MKKLKIVEKLNGLYGFTTMDVPADSEINLPRRSHVIQLFFVPRLLLMIVDYYVAIMYTFIFIYINFSVF